MPERIRDTWRRHQREAAIQEAALQRKVRDMRSQDTSSLAEYTRRLEAANPRLAADAESWDLPKTEQWPHRNRPRFVPAPERPAQRPDVKHWQAQLEDRPIEEGIDAMQESRYWEDPQSRPEWPYRNRPRFEDGRMTDTDRTDWDKIIRSDIEGRLAEAGSQTQADRASYQKLADRAQKNYQSQIAKFEEGRMTDADKNSWQGEDRDPLDMSIIESLLKEKKRK